MRHAAAVLAILLLVPAPSRVLAGPLFGAGTDYVVGSGPYQAAVADLNGDGKLDLVTANGNVATVSVLLGVGNGTFGPKTDFPTASGSAGIAVADFNGDGKLDLVTVNASVSAVCVLLGNGNGTFGAFSSFGAGAWPIKVAVGDLNNDGVLDLVTANANGVSVSVLLGAGNGSFGAQAIYGTAYTPEWVTIGDLNADGKADIVTANPATSSASVLLGIGNGTFPAHVDYSTAARAVSVAIGDLNGDGKPDLATANDDYYGGGGSATVLLGNGNGTFGSRADYTMGLSPRGVAIGDLNGDGRPDIVTANYGYNAPGNSVSVLLGTGGGTFGNRAEYATGLHPNSVALGDFDGDGRPDLVATNSGTNTVSVLLNQPVPLIVGVRDVVNDQGGHVKLLWNASRRDLAPYNNVDSYWVLRSAPSALVARARQAGARVSRDPSDVVAPRIGAFQAVSVQGATYYWEYIASQPAFHSATYSYVAPTTGDSLAGSNPRTAFMVMARTAGGAEWWFSDPDSGYSVDNLPPPVPTPFVGQFSVGTTALHWSPSSAADFASFRLYRGTTPDFVPGPGNLVVTQSDTGYADHAGAPRHYRLSAVDVHGNEGPYAFLSPSGTAGVPAGGAVAFALAGAQPNPVRGGRLSVSFALPANEPARIELIDVVGRRVASREVGALGAGAHIVDLAAGHALAPGLYLLRLTQGSNRRVTRVAVLD